MYTQIWAKYLPVIKILLKKSLKGDQILNLNVSDFKRAGITNNAANKFSIGFSKGKVANVIFSSQLAKSLSETLLDDAIVSNLLLENDYQLTMNTKYQLSISCIPQQETERERSIELLAV